MGTKSVLFHRSVAERKSFRFFVSTIALFMGWSLDAAVAVGIKLLILSASPAAAD